MSARPVTEVPFEVSRYPRADAPCGQAEAPDAEHDPYRGSIRRLIAPDATTVVIELCGPDVALPARLAMPAFAINDTGWLTANAEDGLGGPAIVRTTNGTGPFRLESWSGGAELSLVRSETYRGDDALPERIVVRWDDESGDRLAELNDSSVDGVDALGPAEAEIAGEDPELLASTRTGLSTLYLGFNARFAPFDAALVRQALAIGIDRDALIADTFPPGSVVASHVAPCDLPYGCVGAPWPAYDPILAREWLAQANYEDGFRTTLRYSNEPRDYLPDPTALALALQTQLREDLGIEARLEVVDFETLVASAEAGTLDGLHLLGARPRVADVSAVLGPRFGAGASAEFGDLSEDLVAALQAGASTIDPAARTAAYTTANDSIRALVPMVPIAHPAETIAARADVAGLLASPLGLESFATIVPGDRTQFVWMESAEPAGVYCADETGAAALRTCAQVGESLLAFKPGTAAVGPGLATACVPDETLATWTCTLESGVRFHDGARLDASDVVTSLAAQWDAEHPLHVGRTSEFATFAAQFGGFLNPPSSAGS
ncbi:MAG TPA: ABC transporter substrate-binding protein [Candidatus Limnocylindrales bacterium]